MERISSLEKKVLEDFINSVNKPILVNPFIFTSLISLAGLVLFVSAIVITLNNFVDKTVYWVLFPGMLSGILTMLFGIFLFRYTRKYKQTQKVANVIKKIVTSL